MSVTIANAVNAYRNAAGAADLSPRKANPNDDFSGLLRSAVTEAVQVGKEGEKKSLQAIAGTAELADVISAVSNAEITLQTAVALRDRVIQSYQDILRMPI
ncbi:MAG: flagellar hook-basal body complex protein FliE [Proteobacteria bacterium]|nr:flagellar hook-basal body complex protein FliE [Pseudomonadota bacterium]